MWPEPLWYDEDIGDDPEDRICKICEAEGLHWEEVDGKWLLHDSDGDVHKCPEEVPEYDFDPDLGFVQKPQTNERRRTP